MTDILFGNNNRPVLKLLAKRSLKARRNTIAVLAILLATRFLPACLQLPLACRLLCRKVI